MSYGVTNQRSFAGACYAKGIVNCFGHYYGYYILSVQSVSNLNKKNDHTFAFKYRNFGHSYF